MTLAFAITFKKKKVGGLCRRSSAPRPRVTQLPAEGCCTNNLSSVHFAKRLSLALLGPVETTIGGESLVVDIIDDNCTEGWANAFVSATHRALLNKLFPRDETNPWTKGLFANIYKPANVAVSWTSENSQDHLGTLRDPDGTTDFFSLCNASGFAWGSRLSPPPPKSQTPVQFCLTDGNAAVLAARVFFRHRDTEARVFVILLCFLDCSGHHIEARWRPVKTTCDLWYGKVFHDPVTGTGWRLILVHRWTTNPDNQTDSSRADQNPLQQLDESDKNVQSPEDLRVVSVFFGWVSLVFRRIPDADRVAAFTCHRFAGPLLFHADGTGFGAAHAPVLFCYDARLSQTLSTRLHHHGQELFALRLAAREPDQDKQASALTSRLQWLFCGAQCFVACRIVLGEAQPLPPIVPADSVPPVLAQLTEQQVQAAFAVQIQCLNTSAPGSWMTVWFYERSVAY